ncbi:hypothetical protein Dsin_009340 [Dipteronia sinensis]|uniref:Uncharacterized protein n=1 Tax=Dipteronia sinensis TaxID=43782 RepID=A0AAE0ARE9_9ROSI|nr:hypothetical protein Dsin_009340 [Dipteronia sinensis]
MACLDMYNSNEHNKGTHCTPMSPRISFSNDFAETQQMIKQERIITSREAPPVSSDFEFSVTNYSMMSADELFFKGKLLPFKESCNSQMQRTLREELLVDDDHDQVSNSMRPPKGSSSTTTTRWRGLLGGRKRTHIGSKKADKTTTTTDIGSVVDRVGDKTTRSIFAQQEQDHHSKTSQQEFLSEGGGSS